MYDKLTVQGTIRLLKKLREFDAVEQFVFSSTILVMEPADDEEEVLTESSPLEDEPWDYPKSKIETEKLIRKERGNIKTVILRIGGVYNEDAHTVPVAQQIARIYEKQFESYFYPGDASHGQAFVHLEDLVDCIRKVIERRQELPETDVFIVAEPDLMSYRQLQDEIGNLIHGEEWTTLWIPKFMAKAGAWAQENILGEETFIKPWMVDLADDNFPVSIRHARETLGWNPQKTLRDTLPKMIGKLKQNPQQWYEENGLELPDELEGKKEKSKKA
jgi:nucleoside-diphosphate-sugar epimerase